MGTPDIAVPTLETLLASKHQVIGVVTQPDKPKGRGKAVSYPVVKEIALKHDLPVYQPAKVREEAFVEKVKELNPDVIVVIAFGQIIPKDILEIPRYGCINIHASLLPKYRGAAPIQWAVIDGEEKTGLTTMYMEEGLDTGDMLLKKEVAIAPDETGGSLHDKLASLGGELILETLEKAENGTLVRIKQDDAQSNYAKMLSKTMGHIDFSKPAIEIERLIRGLNPWPSAYTSLDGKTLKIWNVDVLEEEREGEVGEIIEVTKHSVIVKTGMGALTLKEVQLEGKKRMDIEAFLRGYEIHTGTILK